MRKLADLKAAVSVLPHMAEAWRVSRAQDGGGLTVFLFLVSLFFFFIFLFVSLFFPKKGGIQVRSAGFPTWNGRTMGLGWKNES